MRHNRSAIVEEVGARASFDNGIPDVERAGGRNAAAVVAADRAVDNGTAALDTATGQASIVAAKRAVNEGYVTCDPAGPTPWLAIMPAIGCVAADGATRDCHPAGAGDAAAAEIALVAANHAVGNRQHSGAIDPAAKTRGKRITHTSVVVDDRAVDDHQRTTTVVNAAAGAATKVFVIRRDVAGYDAVHERQCRVTVIIGIVVDAPPSKIGPIEPDRAVADCQRCVAFRTVVVDPAATVSEAVLHGAAIDCQCRVIIQNSAATATRTDSETSDRGGDAGHDMEDTEDI